MRFTGSSAMKAMDTYAIEQIGIPSTELMLRAAHGATAAAEQLLQTNPGKTIIFCGSGNNGGDGIAVAAMLLERGYEVQTFMVGKRLKMTTDALEMEQLLQKQGGILEDYDEAALSFSGCTLIVDALFGTGLSRKIAGRVADLIGRINASEITVLACDIPSGISADTGEVLGCAVKANATVTFNLPKTGQLLPPGTEYCGKLIVHDIGIPEEAKATVEFDGEYLTPEMVAGWLPGARLESHKGDYGKLLLLCGSVGYTGAAAMAAGSALRSGAGLVFLGVPESVYPILATKLDEPVVFPLMAQPNGGFSIEGKQEMLARVRGMNAVLFGPGVGTSEDTAALARELVEKAACPLVLDADGLNVFMGNSDVLASREAPLVLTPHEGEFARLGGDISRGRIQAAKELAQRTGAVVVLKGYRTVIAGADGTVYVNSTGNPGMAVGGSGDVLSGIIACFLGQGMPAIRAAAAGVFVHGAAGDICREKLGIRSMLPTDMINALSAVFAQLN